MPLFENYIIGDDNDIECWAPTYWIVQTFTPVISHKITDLRLLLYRQGVTALPGIVTVGIRATVGPVFYPTGPDLCVGYTDGDSLPTGPPYEWREIILGDGYDALIAGTEYAIVMRCLSSSMASQLSWRCDTTLATYPGGNICFSVDSGANWSEAGTTDWDFMFEEWGYQRPFTATVRTDPATEIT